ncbi:hypothetical protein CLAIMM_07483 [Cladophialophora immunda]|nr:hypothetical protein CLAIMM_07483 [Cladophialophora immunda]
MADRHLPKVLMQCSPGQRYILFNKSRDRIYELYWRQPRKHSSSEKAASRDANIPNNSVGVLVPPSRSGRHPFWALHVPKPLCLSPKFPSLSWPMIPEEALE